MPRKIIVVFLSLFLFAISPAWAGSDGQARGALFKVLGNGHTMHLFGTMHVGKPEFFPLEPRIVGLVEGASVLALEIDQEADPAGTQRATTEHMMFAPGTKGYAELKPATRARLDKALAKVNMNFAMVEQMRPWAVAVVMALQEFSSQGFRADLAADHYVANLARAKKVKVLGLESVTSQLSLFTNLPAADQMRFLEDSLEAMETGKQDKEMQDIVDAWSHADQKAIDSLAQKAAEDTTFAGVFTQKVLLEGRNGHLAEGIAELLEKQDKAVAAIGVLHLVGSNSVVTALRARGYTVERVY